MRTHNLISAGLLISLSAGLGLAQSDEPMPGSSERVEQAETLLPRVGTDERPVMPTETLATRVVEPGLTEGHDWIDVLSETLDRRTTPKTLAEGTFLLDRLGQLVRGPSDRLIFVPSHEQRSAGEGPMLLLPCSVQDQISESWSGQKIFLRGEVFVYHGRNYLLPAWFSLVSPETPASNPETPEEAEQVTQTEQPEGDTPASLEDDPEVQALLDELESGLPSGESAGKAIHDQLGTNPTNPVAARSASTASGIREGTILIRRRGRLDRQADGSWALVFDNDDASDLGGESLTILPCRMLMQMETLSARDNGSRELIVSGRVYASQANGYLLPTLVQRVRESGISSRQ